MEYYRNEICSGHKYNIFKEYLNGNRKCMKIEKFMNDLKIDNVITKLFTIEKYKSYSYLTKSYSNVIRKYLSIKTNENEILYPSKLIITGDLNMVNNLNNIIIYNSGHEICLFPINLLLTYSAFGSHSVATWLRSVKSFRNAYGSP